MPYMEQNSWETMSDTEINALQGVAEAEPVAPTAENTEVQDQVTEQPENTDAETAPETEPKPEQPAKKGNEVFHKRIDKLTGRAYAAERERDQVKAQLAEVLSKIGAGEQPQTG